ncbi:MAG: DUF2058 domain-containing protein [Methylococcales bacterium]
MSNKKLSLQEQLLKSGLVSAAKVKTAKSEKHKQAQLQRNNNVIITDEAKALAQRAKAEQAAKDRELNQLRQQQEEQKQLAAQVKQLIEVNRLATDADGIAYHFNDQNKMKTLYVSETMREQLVCGREAIVKLDGQYAVVSAEVARKIQARDAGSVVVFNEVVQAAPKADDPYADYQIPDDLIW